MGLTLAQALKEGKKAREVTTKWMDQGRSSTQKAMMDGLSGSWTKSRLNLWERRLLVEIQQTYCMRVLLRLLEELISGGSGTPDRKSVV